MQQTEGLTSKHKRLKHPPDPTQTTKKKKTKDEATAKTASSSRPGREVQKRTKARRVPEQDGGEGDPHGDSLKAELKRKHRARNASTQSEAPVPQEETAERKQKKVRRKTAAQAECLCQCMYSLSATCFMHVSLRACQLTSHMSCRSDLTALPGLKYV